MTRRAKTNNGTWRNAKVSWRNEQNAKVSEQNAKVSASGKNQILTEASEASEATEAPQNFDVS